MSRLASRLWGKLRNRQSLGSIVIKFYPQSAEASITVDPRLAALARRCWHWLYLQHLAESLAAIEHAEERLRVLVAARAMAEDFVSRSYLPQLIGGSFSDAGAGAADIVPEQAGGVGVTAHVFQRGGAIPAMRLAWFPSPARDRIASANLVFLVHVMRGATHPLEEYELFKKISLFTEYCEQAGCPRDQATLKAGPLYAVVHADVTEMVPPGGLRRYKAAGCDRTDDDAAQLTRNAPSGPAPSRGISAAQRFRDRLASLDPFWKRPCAAIAAATALWCALVLGVFFLPRNDRPGPASQAVASVPAAARPPHAALPPRRTADRPNALASHPRPVASRHATDASPRSAPAPGAAVGHRPARALETAGAAPPRFRVVSGTVALDVAEHRSRLLAEHGVDAFVRERAGKVGRLQYGVYRSREVAEENARHFRAQGYTAVVIPY